MDYVGVRDVEVLLQRAERDQSSQLMSKVNTMFSKSGIYESIHF